MIIASVMLWIVTILGYVIYNLYSKNTKLERMVVERDQILSDLSNTITESDRVLKEIDKLGAFKSDDEIGIFFTTVKDIQAALNQFTTNKIN